VLDHGNDINERLVIVDLVSLLKVPQVEALRGCSELLSKLRKGVRAPIPRAVE
jgi:hypothetical protein